MVDNAEVVDGKEHLVELLWIALGDQVAQREEDFGEGLAIVVTLEVHLDCLGEVTEQPHMLQVRRFGRKVALRVQIRENPETFLEKGRDLLL